jgi:hypothetical protein
MCRQKLQFWEHLADYQGLPRSASPFAGCAESAAPIIDSTCIFMQDACNFMHRTD